MRIKEIARIGKWKLDDLVYKLTGNEHYYRVAETPFYNNSSIICTPFVDELPFFLYVPWNQQKGDEYFIISDHFSQNICTKVVKLSFYRPEYYKGGIITGKNKWIFSNSEKEKLINFLNDDSHWFTNGLSWFSNMVDEYNCDVIQDEQKSLEIPEDLLMPDYMLLPEN